MDVKFIILSGEKQEKKADTYLAGGDLSNLLKLFRLPPLVFLAWPLARSGKLHFNVISSSESESSLESLPHRIVGFFSIPAKLLACPNVRVFFDVWGDILGCGTAAHVVSVSTGKETEVGK